MRFKLEIEYCGTSYCGFQRQSDIKQKSVEEAIAKAIYDLSSEEVDIVVCGRTDAGVHALGQVIHFDLNKELTPYQVIMGMNYHLRDEEVKVLSAQVVDHKFHARFDAKMRHYRYIIINRQAPLALQKDRAWHMGKKLDFIAMKQAATYFLGEHDFSSFRDAECQAKNAIRTIEKLELRENGSEIIVEVSAKSFLHHMVRNIVGTLVYVGLGKIAVSEIANIIAAKDRSKSGPNAPAYGLYFCGVDY